MIKVTVKKVTAAELNGKYWRRVLHDDYLPMWGDIQDATFGYENTKESTWLTYPGDRYNIAELKKATMRKVTITTQYEVN